MLVSSYASHAGAKNIFYQKIDNLTIGVVRQSQTDQLNFRLNKKYIKTFKPKLLGFVSAYWLDLREPKLLLTTWESGSAIRTIVFAIKGNKVKELLSLGSYGSPEIVDIDNDGQFELIFWNDKLLLSDSEVLIKPSIATIYKYINEKYIVLDKRSWDTRFIKNQ